MATHLKSLSDFSHLEVPEAKGMRFGVVAAQWNAKITGELYAGAIKVLLDKGVAEEDIVSSFVPGSYELISGADLQLASTPLDAVICLGCVIQGETPHFDYICSAVAHGISNVALKHGLPVIFGVLTTLDEQQALDRAGGRHGNKGEEAAVTAIMMAKLRRDLNVTNSRA
jgi:6,7-dimethyl-8-ribityllumazine synthase